MPKKKSKSRSKVKERWYAYDGGGLKLWVHDESTHQSSYVEFVSGVGFASEPLLKQKVERLKDYSGVTACGSRKDAEETYQKIRKVHATAG